MSYSLAEIRSGFGLELACFLLVRLKKYFLEIFVQFEAWLIKSLGKIKLKNFSRDWLAAKS